MSKARTKRVRAQQSKRLLQATGTTFHNHWDTDSLPDPATTLLIFDRKLRLRFANLIRRFPFHYGVSAGESLKDLRNFPQHVGRLHKLKPPVGKARLQILALGGGSVGDFAGFFASVYQRGVGLVMMPSTWLAAVDSAHGGKTALNIGSDKNQLGSIYPSRQILICRDLLRTLPEASVADAMGEVIKIAWLAGGDLLHKLEADIHQNLDPSVILWRNLPDLVAAKLAIVNKDPTEKSGHRYLLNLGHSLAHLIELRLGLSHGQAVSYGLRFAIEYSLHMKLLSRSDHQKLMASPLIDYLPSSEEFRHVVAKLLSQKSAAAALTRDLRQDKKLNAKNEIVEVFLARAGKPRMISIPLAEWIAELRRQVL